MHLRSTLTCSLQVDVRIPFTTPVDCRGPTLAAVFRRQFLRVVPCNSIEIVLQWNAASLPLSSRCAGIDPSPLERAVRVVVQPTLDVVGVAARLHFSPTAPQAHSQRRRLPRGLSAPYTLQLAGPWCTRSGVGRKNGGDGRV